MKTTHTGIAVALALTVIVLFFIFPMLSPLGQSLTPTTGTDETTALTSTSNNSSTTMPADNSDQLQITDETIGTGATAEDGDTVTVNYVGSLTDGTVFDASANHGTDGFTFTLGAGQVIAGWDQGIAGMKEGGTRKLVIPASLAYGDRAVGNVIPANSTLIFEVELVKVVKAAQ